MTTEERRLARAVAQAEVIRAAAQRLADEAPPLSQAQKDRLTAVFNRASVPRVRRVA